MTFLPWTSLVLALLLCGCRYSGPCELQLHEPHDPTAINDAEWIRERSRPQSSGGPRVPYYRPNFVVTGVEAEVSAYIISSRCQPNDPRLLNGTVTVTAPSGSVTQGRIWFGESHPVSIHHIAEHQVDPSRVTFQTRLIFTPAETGLHTLLVDYGTEGVMQRRVFVSQSHTWEEMVAALPWRCVNVERTRLGTWICDNHALGPAGERHDFPAGAFVTVDGSRLYVWTDTGLEVFEETASAQFSRLGGFDVASTLDERHQLLRREDRLLLVSARELRLLRVDASGLVLQEGQGATPIALRPEDAGPSRWEWGVSFTAEGVLMAEHKLYSSSPLEHPVAQICSLDVVQFRPLQCVPAQGGPVAVNGEGVWVSDGNVATVRGISDGGIASLVSYSGTTDGSFFRSPLSSALKPGARRTPVAHIGNLSVCGLPKTEPDGGMVYHVYPQEEPGGGYLTYRSFPSFCDASFEYVWYWKDEYKSETFVFGR